MESSQPAGRTFSIVIATYYSADSLPLLFVELDKFEKKLLSLGLNLELIFVDDGSGDDSFARLVEFRKVRPKTKLVRLARNFGAVAAIKAGMKFVTGDCFMPFPADLQDPLDDVVRMVEQWIAGHKLVLAVRRSRADPLMTRANEDEGRYLNAGLIQNKESYGARAVVFDRYSINLTVSVPAG